MIIIVLVLIYIAILLIYLKKESKNKKQEYVKTGIGCLGMIGLMSFIIFTQQYDWKNLEQHKKQSIGKVIGYGKKNSIKWEFTTLSNKKIEIFDSKKFKGLQIGEFYEIEYDSTDLKNARANLSKPIINFALIDTIYDFTFPYEKIDNSNIYVTFKYEFNGINYERQQKLPRDKNWGKIEKFIVVIDLNNPKIGYLIPNEE